MNDINKVILPCSVGCLEHVIGITYFKFDGYDDQPELYFETLHRPYEGFWRRLWHGIKFTFNKVPMSSDSTLLGVESAEKLIEVCQDYIQEHNKWEQKYG